MNSRLHPLSLIILALWFSTAALFVPDPAWLGAALLLCVLFRGFLAGFAWRLWLRQFLKMLPLFVAILIIQALFTKEGGLLWGKGWYSFHSLALQRGIAFSLRLLILFWSAQILLKLDYEDFDLAFRALRLPEELGFMVFYAVRVIPLAGRKINRDRQLLRLRGLELSQLPIKDRIRIYSRVSLSLLAEVLSRSAIQATALDLRGFRSSGPVSHLERRSFAWADLLLMASLLLLSALYFAL